jgi:hypothetical protein
MEIKEVLSWAELPSQGMQIWSPKFQSMDLSEIPNEINAESEWMPFGYDYGIVCRGTSTLHLFMSVKP